MALPAHEVMASSHLYKDESYTCFRQGLSTRSCLNLVSTKRIFVIWLVCYGVSYDGFIAKTKYSSANRDSPLYLASCF